MSHRAIRRFMKIGLLARNTLPLAAILTLASYLTYAHVRQIRYDAISDSIKWQLHSLHARKPPDTLSDDWGDLVGCSITCHVNCLAPRYAVPIDKYREFESELIEAVRQPDIDEHFFDWYWRRLSELSEPIKLCSVRYRDDAMRFYGKRKS